LGAAKQTMKTKINKNMRVLIGFAVLTVGFIYLLTSNSKPYIISSTNAIVNLQNEEESSISGEADLFSGVAVERDSSSYETVENKIRAAFPEDPDTAVAIAKAESNLEDWRIGDKHLAWDDGRNGMSCGIFQIRVFPKRPDCEKLLDEDFNIDYARELYESSGWSPWSTFKSGRYKKFLG